MPIYEYQCGDCGERYEKLVMASANGRGPRVVCPKCASAKQHIQLSVFSAGNSSGSRPASSGSCGCTPRGCGCH